MATFYWKGGATAVAQTATVQITANDVATTYTLTAGDATASVVGNAAGANDTATDLAAAWEALTHPHAAAVSAVAATDTITLAAVVPGVPFTVAAAATGGTGTIGSVTETVANAGPASAKTVANYVDSNGDVATALPTGSDTLVLRDEDGYVAYDLEALTGSGMQVEVEQSYTGRIGLAATAFATSADGTSTADAREYRQRYLKGPFAAVTVGRHTGTSNPPGAARCKIWTTYTSAGSIVVERTASSASETYRTPVQLRADSANMNLFVRNASGGVGVAADRADETATLGAIKVTGANSTVVIAAGTTFTSYEQAGGDHKILGAAATVTSITTSAGSLAIDGDFTATTITVRGGTVTDNHSKTGGNLATTVTVEDGTYNLGGTDETRAGGTLTRTGGSVVLNPNVTWSTLSLGRGTVR